MPSKQRKQKQFPLNHLHLLLANTGVMTKSELLSLWDLELLWKYRKHCRSGVKPQTGHAKVMQQVWAFVQWKKNFCPASAFLQQPQAAELPVHLIAVLHICPQTNSKTWLSLQLVSELVKIFLCNQGLYHSLEGKGHCNYIFRPKAHKCSRRRGKMNIKQTMK